ncbi:hypothetical protein Taro_023639 [Colocasia esculenta]|uniref:Uncharacterized protein n=1 Tax=Colocasia esculenta TaxID=4460 RepID=A0A843VC19_COLES|nr:hypothetical protein [Colocasia esculenta]
MSILKKELRDTNRHGFASSSSGTYISCKGSVDTPLTGVDTVFQTLRQNVEEKVKCVDTALSGVDTRPSSQRTQLTGLYSVSTQPQVSRCVSTLVTLPREPILLVLDSVLTHSLDRSTHSENFFTLSSTWTRGTLGFTWIGLGTCAHAPQGYFWTHWAINTLQLAIQPKRTFSEPSRNPFGGKKSSPPRSCSSCAVATKFSSLQAQETEEQWARGHKELYHKFLLAKSARFPPRDHSLTLSEWFQIHHKNCWAPFIQKEIKMARHFQLFNNYRYVHRLLEVQLSQFKQAISALGSAVAHTEAVQVDFATLQLPEEISLPPIHSLIMESSVGSIIFERFARVMGRIKVQKGFLVVFHRFLFREYHQGLVSAEVLAPILSECEILSPSDWARFYPLSAQQLSDLNDSQAKEGHPPVSPATFLDMNSIHLVQDPFRTWVERYKVYVVLCQELKAK